MVISRVPRSLLAVVASAVTALTPLAAPTASATTQTTNTSYNGLALTPPMGFNDWQYYRCDINENIIVADAKALVTTGLARHGYNYVNVDDCWLANTRDTNGNLQADPTTFPHGIKWLADYVHSLGLKFGIYEDGGYRTCGGYPGMYGHIQQDADTFAAWGVDYLKLDYCNQPLDQYPGDSAAQVAKIVYSQVSQALLSTGRKIVFSESAPAYYCCSGSDFTDIMSWIGTTGNLWRFGDDIQPTWSSILTNYGEDNTPGLAAYAGPGHWNDADMLLAGTSGTTATEQQSQFSLWAELASPLLLSADLGALSKQTIGMLSNSGVIAVDQDPLGAQGTIVASGTGYDVLAKPLAGGDVAVALFNKAATAQTISTTAGTIGLQGAGDYALTDLWAHQSTETRGTIAADVPAHGVVLYRVHRGSARWLAPSIALSTSAGDWRANAATPVTVTVADNGSTGIEDVGVRLTLPAGWTAEPATRRTPLIRPGGTASVAFEVTAPAQPPGITSTTLGVDASYHALRGPAQLSGQLTAVIDTPYPSLASAFDNVGITDDADTDPSDLGTGFDDYDGTFSAQALAATGATPGGAVTAGGLTFTWPNVAAGTPDNVIATGQTIDLTGSGSTLGFLASSGFGPAGGTGTITYTDGTTQTFTVSAPDWTSVPAGADVAISTPYHNIGGSTTADRTTTDVYLATVALDAGKTVASVALPTATGSSSLSTLHVFAMAIG